MQHEEQGEYAVEVLLHVGSRSPSPYIVDLTINDAPLQMELDTGAGVSLISEVRYKTLWESLLPLQPVTDHLRTYSREKLRVLGKLEAKSNMLWCLWWLCKDVVRVDLGTTGWPSLDWTGRALQSTKPVPIP